MGCGGGLGVGGPLHLLQIPEFACLICSRYQQVASGWTCLTGDLGQMTDS